MAIEQQLDPGRRLLVTIAVMLAVLIQVLDTTIANVALPHMQASLGATQESVNWVLTSYIVASAIALPISLIEVAPDSASASRIRASTSPSESWAGR